MRKKTILIFATITILLFTSQATASLVGFGPADIYTSNKRDKQQISQATLINGEQTPKYGIFRVFKPYSHNETFQPRPSQMKYCRVQCQHCGWAGQRYEVNPSYEYGDPLEGHCPQCQGTELTFYKPIPRDELRFISLRGTQNFNLEKTDPYTWKTTEKIQGKGTCSVDILYNPSQSYLEKNLGEHWELHLRGTLQESPDAPMGVVGGVDLKIFIHFKFPLYIKAPRYVEKGENFTVKTFYAPPDKQWKKIPNQATITFNGETKQIDENGYASFTMPNTRYDYDYTAKAESPNFLSISKTISSGKPEVQEEQSFINIPTNFIPLIFISIIVAIAVTGVVIWRIKKPWYH